MLNTFFLNLRFNSIIFIKNKENLKKKILQYIITYMIVL